MTEVTVCIGSSCHLKGSYNVMQAFQQMIEECGAHDRVELKAAFCMKACHNKGVSVTVDGTAFDVAPEQARTFFRAHILGTEE